jgi:hypothetical protein
MWKAARLSVMFSFETHYSFIGERPYIGSLFTLLLPFVILVPNARRLWWGVYAGMGALFAWGMTYWIDRNLQTFMPILVATSAAIIARIWTLGNAARAALVPLIGLQLVWGADFMLSGSDRLQQGVSLLKSGFDGRSASRYNDYRRDYREVGHALPKDAVAVLHNWHVKLGINRRILLDWIGFQGLIDYRTFKSPRQAFDRFASLGVTHVISLPGNRPAPSKQEEVIFDTLAGLYLKQTVQIGPFAVYEMPHTPPPEEMSFRVLTISLGSYADGIYLVENLGSFPDLPLDFQNNPPPETPVAGAESVLSALGRVNAVVLGGSTAVEPAATDILQRHFRVVPSHPSFRIYAREPGG